jgi:hypothetical protein
MRRFAFPYPLLLLVFWTGLLLMGDWVVLETSARQWLSRRFAATTGKIIQCDLGRGAFRSRGVEMAYTYAVGGVEYTGHRYRYDERHGAFDYAATARGFPAGARRAVYYDPANPAESVLNPGLDGCDLLLALFGLPFNIATGAVWVAVLRAKRGPKCLARAGGVRIIESARETRARLAGFSPLAAGFLGVGATAFGAVFPIVSLAGFAPSPQLMTIVLGLVAAAGLAAYAWAARRNGSGRYDLRIDEATQTLTVPQTGRRKTPLTVPRGEIAGVSMRRRVSKTPSGNYVSYVPVLDRAAPGCAPQPIELVRWGWTEGKARGFAEWLGGQLGVRCKGVEEESEAIGGESWSPRNNKF